MYENLGLKNEFSDSLRNYTLLVFQTGDLNKIKDIFLKYNLLDTTKEDKKVVINELESVQNMISFFDDNICRQ